MQATALEYRFRYLIHGLIYALGFAAPWSRPMWNFTRNGSTVFQIANTLAKPSYLHFASYWNVLIAVMLVFAIAGAALRVSGAAYLGAATVQRGEMVGDRVVTGGPFRYTRNPLYLGTLLNTVALAMLMRPEAGVLTLALIAIVQLRLIAREEPYLSARLGAAYTSYFALVPRLLPTLRPRVAASSQRAQWQQGALSELFVLGCVVAIAIFGWSSGFSWEGNIVRVMQAILVSLGLSFVARAFLPAPASPAAQSSAL